MIKDGTGFEDETETLKTLKGSGCETVTGTRAGSDSVAATGTGTGLGSETMTGAGTDNVLCSTLLSAILQLECTTLRCSTSAHSQAHLCRIL